MHAWEGQFDVQIVAMLDFLIFHLGSSNALVVIIDAAAVWVNKEGHAFFTLVLCKHFRLWKSHP